MAPKAADTGSPTAANARANGNNGVAVRTTLGSGDGRGKETTEERGTREMVRIVRPWKGGMNNLVEYGLTEL